MHQMTGVHSSRQLAVVYVRSVLALYTGLGMQLAIKYHQW